MSTTTPQGPGLVPRAARGAVLLAARSVAIRIVGLLGNIVVARILVPEEFGVLALGLTLTTVVGLFSNVGLGAGIIRRPEDPDRRDLQTVMTTSFALSACSIPVLFALVPAVGETVAIAAVMVVALPIQTLRSPDGIVLERELSYGPVARVDIVETLVSTVLSVLLVVLGAGVWGVAVVSPIRAVVGTLLMWRIGPVGYLQFGFSRARARVLIGEGATFAAQDVVGLVRDQGTNVAIASLGGLSALGAWSLQGRLMLIPLVILASLYQVAFPAMSRAGEMTGGGDQQIKRALGLTAVGLGMPAAILIGTSQSLVPALFGPGWGDVSDTLPYSVAAILVAGPPSVALGSKLFADRRGRVVVLSAILHTAVIFGLIFALYQKLGLVSVGIASFASGLVEVTIFAIAVRGDSLGFMVASLRPTLAAGAGALSGLAAAQPLGEDLIAVILEGALAGTVTPLTMALIARPQLLDFLSVLNGARRRRAQPTQSATSTT